MTPLNAPQELFRSTAFILTDPASGGNGITITCDRQFMFYKLINKVASETRTLTAQPSRTCI